MAKAKKPVTRKRVFRTVKAVAAHVQLANAIIRGEFSKPCTMNLLRHVYFQAPTDEACERKLAGWAKRHGILYEKRPLTIDAAGVQIKTYEVTFRRR